MRRCAPYPWPGALVAGALDVDPLVVFDVGGGPRFAAAAAFDVQRVRAVVAALAGACGYAS